MAYENFIPSVWATGIERDLERMCVFAEDCNRNYEGNVREVGDTVRIFGVGKPTIHTMERKDASGEIAAAEEVADTSISLAIKQIRYFNFKVGDIDRAQSVKGLMDAIRKESSEGLADEIDRYIAAFATHRDVKSIYAAPKKLVAGTAGEGEINVLHALEEAAQALYENDVKQSTKIVAPVSPRFYTLFLRAYTDKDTDNSEMMKNGRVGKYGNIIVKMSNNVARSGGGAVDHIMVRTQRAIAYANPLTHVEPYRPEKMFADAVKGFELFDACVARPKEVVSLNLTY